MSLEELAAMMYQTYGDSAQDDWLRMAEWLETYGFPGDDETLRDLDALIYQEIHG
jgi:hypothetical protein